MKEVILCGRGKCCPRLKQADNGDTTIADDYGNEIYMNESQFSDLKHRIKSGEFD